MLETANRLVAACGFDLRIELAKTSPQRQVAIDAALAHTVEHRLPTNDSFSALPAQLRRAQSSIALRIHGFKTMNLNDLVDYGVTSEVIRKLQASGLRQLTETQAKAIGAGLCRGANLVVSAPTSSGKTTIAEIAAIEGALRGQKTVYLVTHRALAEEKFLRFTKDYSNGAGQMV